VALTADAVAAELKRVKALHAEDHDPQALAACAALAGALPGDLPDAARFEVLWQLADLHSHEDHHEQAIAAYAACEPLLVALGKTRGRVVSRNNRGYHFALLGRRDEALALLKESRELSRVAGQPMLLRAYSALAYWHLEWGQADEAESAARVAVQQARAWNDPAELGASLLQLARVLAKTDRTDRALLHYTEAIPLLDGPRPGQAAEARAESAALASVPPAAR
jgi:tetratricopeptide (TPR) repeat protein